MTSSRSQIIELIEQGAIPEQKIGDALIETKVTPDSKSWIAFMDRLLLWLGSLALAFAVMFFIAYNWNEIGRFAKFGILEGLIILAIAAYCKLGEHSTSSKASLMVAAIFLGVLLALYGQTYQTGADPWQLFFSWALLMLPWAIIGRFPAIWIVWVALINVSIFLYYQTVQDRLWLFSDPDTGVLWLFFCCNTLVFIIWEFTAKTFLWLSARWAIRLLAVSSGFPITFLVLHSIFSYDEISALPGLVWAIWLVLMYIVYRKNIPDLFMLAGCCLSAITVSLSFLAEHMLDDWSAGSFLFLALAVICMGAGAAFWLKNVHQEFQS